MQKINNGDTGAQAADKIFNNDLQSVLQWQAEEYPINTVVFKDGKFYKNNAPAIATDIPGISNIWVLSSGGVAAVFDKTNDTTPQAGKQIYDASEDIVKHALASEGTVTTIHGVDLNYVVTTALTPAIFCNLAPLTSNDVIKNVVVRALTSGTIKVYKINAGPTPGQGSSITRTLLGMYAVTVGTNTIVLDIPGAVGDMIGIDLNGITTGGTTTGATSYFDGISATINLNPGYIAYYYETVQSGVIESPLDNLETIVKIPPGDFNKILKGGESMHSRITIEGQSNALGVGLYSGLSAPPFNTATFNWALGFSRVFIWNPKTDAYENIKIGVNNMASWDADYTTSPTASSFGPEVGVALTWLQTHKFGNLYIDKNVGDGQPIAYFQKGGAYYSEKLDRKTKADTWLSDRGISVNEAGFIWVQGEGDMSQTKDYYLLQLTNLIDDRIADAFIDSKTRLVITQIPNTSANYGAGPAAAKVDYVAGNKLAKLVTYPTSFNGDNIHLNTSGQISLAISSAKACLVTDTYTFTTLETKTNWTE